MTAPEDFGQRLRLGRWGVLLALLTIFFGFGLGGVFGAFEEPLRAGLTERAETVRDSVYGGDAAKMKSVVDKSWGYYKRAHLHGGGIGAASLGAILLLAALRRPKATVRRGLSLAVGLGGLGYATFWALAARRAPGLGSTDAAKESLAWLAVPSAGLLLLGLLAVVVLTAIELFWPARKSTQIVRPSPERPQFLPVQLGGDPHHLVSASRAPSSVPPEAHRTRDASSDA